MSVALKHGAKLVKTKKSLYLGVVNKKIPENSMKKFIIYLFSLLALSSCTEDLSYDDSDFDYTTNSNYVNGLEVNKWIFNQMNANYYWSANYTQSFVNSLNFNTTNPETFFNSLLDVPSSKLSDSQAHDGNIYSGEHYPYSYMSWSYSSGRASSTTEYYYTLGFVFNVDTYDYNNVFFPIYYVMPSSSASEAGVTRDHCITAINGIQLTMGNYYNYAMSLLYTDSPYTLTLSKLRETNEGGTADIYCYKDSKQSSPIYITEQKTASVSMRTTEVNPVHAYTTIDTQNGKVGYICYNEFTFYSTSFEEAFADLQAQAIDKIIVDLRYNLGGYVDTSVKFSSHLAGSSNIGRVCCYMKNAEKTNLFAPEYITSRTPQFDFNDIYFITGGNTASASEIVINSMYGLGKNVIIVGETSCGKNVGSYSLSSSNLSGYSVSLQPITFQLYNNLNESNYANGFTPDYPYYESWCQERLDLGDTNEQLLSYTISIIEASAPAATLTSKSASQTSTTKLSVPQLRNVQGAIYTED